VQRRTSRPPSDVAEKEQAEADLLNLVDAVGSLVDKLNQDADRSILERLLGPPYVRIARIRHLIKSLPLSEQSKSDARYKLLCESCDVAEATLRDLPQREMSSGGLVRPRQVEARKSVEYYYAEKTSMDTDTDEEDDDTSSAPASSQGVQLAVSGSSSDVGNATLIAVTKPVDDPVSTNVTLPATVFTLSNSDASKQSTPKINPKKASAPKVLLRGAMPDMPASKSDSIDDCIEEGHMEQPIASNAPDAESQHVENDIIENNEKKTSVETKAGSAKTGAVKTNGATNSRANHLQDVQGADGEKQKAIDIDTRAVETKFQPSDRIDGVNAESAPAPRRKSCFVMPEMPVGKAVPDNDALKSASVSSIGEVDDQGRNKQDEETQGEIESVRAAKSVQIQTSLVWGDDAPSRVIRQRQTLTSAAVGEQIYFAEEPRGPFTVIVDGTGICRGLEVDESDEPKVAKRGALTRMVDGFGMLAKASGLSQGNMYHTRKKILKIDGGVPDDGCTAISEVPIQKFGLKGNMLRSKCAPPKILLLAVLESA